MTPSIFAETAAEVRKVNRLTFRLLGLLGRIRPDERRDVAAAVLVLFAFMTGHALLETARDALFLAALPARQLPWLYLVIAGGALAAGRLDSGDAGRMAGRNPMRGLLVGVGAVTLAFWLVLGARWPGIYHVLYVWSGILATLVVVRFWTVLGSLFSLTQAKRIFPVIASASVAGAILGSGLAAAVTPFIPPRHLVLLAGGVLLLAALVPMRGPERDAGGIQATPRPEKLGDTARLIWAGPYLRRVAVLVLLAAVTFTLVDFTFKSAADRLVAPDRLGEFFASVYLGVNLLSLVVQLFVVSWLLRHLGLVNAVAAVPAVLLLATLGFAAGGTLVLAMLLKGADGSLRHSLYRTGAELLFIPLSQRLRTRVKSFIDVVGQRGGQALASILILVVLSTTARESVFAGMACLTAMGWLLLAVGLREPYLNLFRDALSGEARADARLSPELDVASLSALMGALSSPDDDEVLAALGILEGSGRIEAVPNLILYHPSPRVSIRALDIFAASGRADAAPLARRLLESDDAGVREAAVRALAVLAPDREMLEAAAGDPAANVRVTARTMLVAQGWAPVTTAGYGGGRDSTFALDGILGPEPATPMATPGPVAADAGEAAAVARALRLRPVPGSEEVVRRLLRHPDAAVARDGVQAARALGSPNLVPALVEALGRRTVRADARLALAALGAPGLPRLLEALRDPGLPSSIRRHVPGAMALVGLPQVPTLLLKHLHQETDGMIRFKVIRALGRWRREQPSVPLDGQLIQEALGQAVSAGFRLMEWRQQLQAVTAAAPELGTELQRVLLALLRDKQDHALERIFRILNLQAGTEEFHRIYRGVHSADPAVRAGSRELLQHMILPHVRRSLMTLVDDLHGELPGPTAEDLGRDEPLEVCARVLGEIVDCGMESTSSLAALHAAELGLVSVLPALRQVEPVSREHAGVLGRARTLLEPEAA